MTARRGGGLSGQVVEAQLANMLAQLREINAALAEVIDLLRRAEDLSQ